MTDRGKDRHASGRYEASSEKIRGWRWGWGVGGGGGEPGTGVLPVGAPAGC